MGVTLKVATTKLPRLGSPYWEPGLRIEEPRWSRLTQRRARPARTVLQGALATLARALEEKDRYTVGHASRVRCYAEAMARELCLPASLVAEIGIGAALHDVGKIGTPDELLSRPAPLSAEERARLLRHTVVGERILQPLMRGRPVVLGIVRWHHERFDGRGYPDGLAGEAIPMGARIVAVADAFDAMVSSRPYRPARSFRAALCELARCAGTQFDPRCVAALQRVVLRGYRGVPAQRLVYRQGRAAGTPGRSPCGSPSLPCPSRWMLKPESRAPPAVRWAELAVRSGFP